MKALGNPLDNVRVASPCRADWNRMYGSETIRHCRECRMNVYNLSAMSRDEAEALLVESEGRLCVRFYRRADGTIITNDCPIGLAAVKIRMRRVASATASLILTFLSGLLGVRATQAAISLLPLGGVPAPAVESVTLAEDKIPEVGEVTTIDVMGEVVYPIPEKPNRKKGRVFAEVGRVENVERSENSKAARIKQ